MGAITGFDSIKKNCDYKKAYEACQKKKTPISNGPVPNADACGTEPPTKKDPVKKDPVKKDWPPPNSCGTGHVTRASNLRRAEKCDWLCPEEGPYAKERALFADISKNVKYARHWKECQRKKTPIPNGPCPVGEKDCKDSPVPKEDKPKPPPKKDDKLKPPPKKDDKVKPPAKKDDKVKPPAKKDDKVKPPAKKEEKPKPTPKKDDKPKTKPTTPTKPKGPTPKPDPAPTGKGKITRASNISRARKC
jgi:hypothetical protein